MLPEKVFSLDYQDYSNLVEQHLDEILKYENTNHIKFDFIIGKIRNGLIGASIVSNSLHLDMGTIDTNDNNIDSLYIPLSYRNKMNSNLNILFVDSTCNTGETLDKVKILFKKFYPNINIVSYCTLINQSAKIKPDIRGLIVNKCIQTPWERFSFTPQTHLDRLEKNKLKTDINDSFYIGFCSEECKEDIRNILPLPNEKRWYSTFHYKEDHIPTSSGISSHIVPEKITIQQAKTKYKKIIEEKKKFIEDNGLTHFIEDNLEQATLLANQSPVCHVLFYADNSFYKITAKETDKKNLFIKL